MALFKIHRSSRLDKQTGWAVWMNILDERTGWTVGMRPGEIGLILESKPIWPCLTLFVRSGSSVVGLQKWVFTIEALLVNLQKWILTSESSPMNPHKWVASRYQADSLDALPMRSRLIVAIEETRRGSSDAVRVRQACDRIISLSAEDSLNLPINSF